MKNLKKLTIVGAICLSNLIATSVFAADTAKVTAETARMRKEANSSSAIVTLISMNEEVTVIEKSGDWYKVKYNGKTGYISKSLLDVEEDEASDKKTNPENNTVDNSTTENITSQNSTTEQNTINSTQEDETSKQENTENPTEERATTISENYKGMLKNKVEVRILPLINSTKILTIEENSEIQVVEIVNNWCSVKSANNYGWVLKDKLEESLQITQVENSTNTAKEEEKQEEKEEQKPEETNGQEKTEETKTTTTKTGYVNVDTVNVRKEKSTSSAIITNLNKNAEVKVLGEEDNWSKVEINGVTGYIASKYISDKKVEVTSRGAEEPRQPTTITETQNGTTEQVANNETTQNTQKNNTIQNTTSTNTSTTTSSSNGNAVVNYAKQYLGTKYVSGGSSPSTGFDCSGFTSYVYKHFGKTLSRTSSGQRSNGTAVSKSDLQAGDLVCFTGHVGIYIGGNKFIHAANPKKGVIITSLSDSYYTKNYITARRIK